VNAVHAENVRVTFDEESGRCEGCDSVVGEYRAGLHPPIPKYYAHSVLECLRILRERVEVLEGPKEDDL